MWQHLASNSNGSMDATANTLAWSSLQKKDRELYTATQQTVSSSCDHVSRFGVLFEAYLLYPEGLLRLLNVS
jgi:hypothetical protein